MKVTLCDWVGCQLKIDGPVRWQAGLGGVDADGDGTYVSLDACSAKHLDFAVGDWLDKLAPRKEAETNAGE